jgi:hypothetical protein
LLNKLASRKLWCPLCLCLSPPETFLGAHLGFAGWFFHLLVTSSVSLAPLEGPPCQTPPNCVDPEEGAVLLASQGGEFRLHKGTWKGLGTNLGALLIRLVRTWVHIQACLRRQKRSLINSQRHPSNRIFGGETLSFRFREVVDVLCCVRVCESASLRCCMVTKRVWSPDPWVPPSLLSSLPSFFCSFLSS